VDRVVKAGISSLMLAQQGFFPSKTGSIVGVIVVDIMDMIIDLSGQKTHIYSA
jgi:hypothetical protein